MHMFSRSWYFAYHLWFSGVIFIAADCLLLSHNLFEATCTLLSVWIGTIGTIKGL